MSLVKDLSHSILEQILAKLPFKEDLSLPQNLKSLSSAMSPDPVGGARVFEDKESGSKLVYIGLTVPMIALDSHMLFCFSKSDSLVPHFTLDAVAAGEHYAYHLDLIPRVDLSCHPDYLFEVYEPLNDSFKKAESIKGLSKAHLEPLQLAYMSPWMLAHRADLAAMDKVGVIAGEYLNHWLSLSCSGMKSKSSFSSSQITERDRQHRTMLFSPKVDPVWAKVTKMVGKESCDGLRSLLLPACP